MNKLKVIFVVIIFTSCQEKALESQNIINVNPDAASIAKTSSFINNVEYVRLSTEGGAQLGAIDKLVVSNNRIYILDSRIAVALFIYDLKGNLIFDIQRFGRGPGEFMGPYDFAIDEKKEEIIIYDARGAKLSKYNLSDGSFIEDVLIDFRFRRFEVMNEKYVFYLDNRPSKDLCCNIVITDKAINIEQEYIEIKPGMRGSYFNLPNNFFAFKNSLLFTAQSDHNVYRIQNDELKIYKTIDFGEYKLPEEYFKEYDSYQERWETVENAVMNISNYIESESYFFFNYWFDDDLYYYFSSKKENKVIHFSKGSLTNDLNAGPEIVWPMTIVGETMVWVQQPNWLFDFIEKKKETLEEKEWQTFMEENESLINFSKSLTKGDENPYLMFTKINF